MADSTETKIGRIIDVRGGGMVAVLDSPSGVIEMF